MEEKNDDSFFQVSENIEKFQKKYTNVFHENQSTEIMPSEDIFLDQKEEIKKIKKHRLELKAFRDSYKERPNLKCIQIKKDINSPINNVLNTIESNKSDNQENKQKIEIEKRNKSNLSNYNILKDLRKIIFNKNIKPLQFKFINNVNDNNENNDNNDIDNNNNKETEINNNTKEIDIDIDIEKDNISDNIIINNDSETNTVKNIENEIDFLSLSNIDYFEKCECRLKGKDNNDNDENNLPIINEQWTNLYDLYTKNEVISNFEFSKTALRTKNYIDYNTKGIEININLKLFSQSSFYIFTRCYMDEANNEINNSFIDNNSESIKKNKTQNIPNFRKNKINQIFSKYSTVIKIFKNRNSKKAFVSFGTFYKSKRSGNIHYKTFLQRQLVDYLHQDKNYYYLENDLCEFNIIVIDSGNEYLEAKISLNNKERFNNIKSNFYLPVNQKAKIVFCGEGKSTKVTDLKIRSFSKYDEDKGLGLLLSSEQKSCDCCVIA